MKEQKERTVYIAPVTERFVVEMEGGFMAGSVMVDGQNTVTTGDQDVNRNWDNFTTSDYRFSSDGWN